MDSCCMQDVEIASERERCRKGERRAVLCSGGTTFGKREVEGATGDRETIGCVERKRKRKRATMDR